MPRPTTLAEGRSCLGVGPTRKPVLKGRLYAPFCKAERRDRGLDSVARDHPADSLMPQDRQCLAYPHSTGPGPTRQGVGPTWGRALASDRWLNQVGHLHPAGYSTVHGAPPLSASQAGFGLPAGCPCLEPGPLQPLLRSYHGGRRLGWEPLGCSTTWHGPPRWAPSGISGPPGGTGLRLPRVRLGPPRVRECPTIPRDPCNTHVAALWPPGWQVLQVAQTVAIPCHGPPTDFTPRQSPSQPDCSQTATVSAGLIHTRNDSDRQRFILARTVFITSSSWNL